MTPGLFGRALVVVAQRRGPAGLHRLLLARVRSHHGAAAIFRRARDPGRRPPEDRLRPGHPDHRRGPALQTRLLQADPPARRLAGGTLYGPRPLNPPALAAPRGRRNTPP